MLILSRRIGESVTIRNDIHVTVVSVNGNQVRLGIDAPRQVRVLRQEIFKAMEEENRAAADARGSGRRLEDVAKQLRRKSDDDSDDG